MPSKTGGRSSNSGTDWPGTNSARWMRISIVDGATRTVTPRWWHWSTSSTARSCGKSGSAMMTSWTRSLASTAGMSSIVPSDRSPLSGRGVSEMKPTISTGDAVVSLSACATSSMCGPDPTSIARRR